ncbi:restriction endonuclease subunit S [Desulfosudis oleivorans]|uniref:Restriction modification system DNA specificity domain n=1 Tax=Desulfosudis oleivorans (strain DSM 6200 / JCM 39069 / Hxd3) TaxID=96561 RepID=A8ZVS3_DESOH|nr:restriction endonuclease subunit S [Desulfosudis oleivorans]ABW66632.1 restriction modification system DNA specificity domain [Desulfosudis oleivorans Hxd3]
MKNLITDHLDIWTAAQTPKANSGRGRGSNANGHSLHGIKKLRELILELAVRGKLVPQDPNDEPASELLKKIGQEKARLIKNGKIKKQNPLPKITEDEKPQKIPSGWNVTRLGEVLNVLNGRAYKNHEMLQEGTPLLRVGNLFTSDIWYYSDLALEPEKYIDNGDLIYAWSASFGPFIWQGGKVIYHYHIWKLDLFDESCLYKNFLYHYLAAVTEKIKASGSGIAMIHMTKARMEKLVIMVPPLAEQHRIVTKVDELMALCDRLEQEQSQSIETHQTLVKTLLAALTTAGDAKACAQTWQQIADHFEILFTTEQSIDHLKQTILQLAVMGKLVPQDPNDEPASVLLEKIDKEKARLIKAGKIKNQTPLPKITEDEKPFDLPEGWEWVRFNQLIEPNIPISYGVLVPGPDVENGVPFVRIGDLDLINPPKLPEKSIDKEIDRQYERTRLLGGEILMGVVGSIGKLGVAPDSWRGANIARAICRIAPTRLILKQYLIWLLQTDLMQSGFIGATRTLAQPTLNVGLIRAAATPLPPLAEQHRIVAKVDKLMALCDTLKERLHQAQTIQTQLSDAIVGQALA